MSSNNIDENQLLKHVCCCFQAWGITYIRKDILKKGQQNSPEAIPALKHLLFDLCILHITEFQHTHKEMGIKYEKQEQESIQQFILAFLSEIRCPYVTQDHNSSSSVCKLNFERSRGLLLIVGWVMAVSDFFEKIRTVLIQKCYRQIYIEPKYQKKANNRSCPKSNLTIHADESLDSKFKRLSQIEYKSQCYQMKKQKLLKKLQKKLNSHNKSHQTNIKMEALISENKIDAEQEQDMMQRVAHLQFILESGVRGIKTQQYFWMWMQLKVSEAQIKELKNSYEQFEWIEVNEFSTSIKPDPNYLKEYLTHYKSIEETLQELNAQFQEISPFLSPKNPKNSSYIEKEVKSDISKILNMKQEDEKSGRIPCFLAIETNKYLQGHGFSNKKGKKKGRMKRTESGKISELLKKQLKAEINEFIDKLQSIKFI